jgi:uncharacterized membrane protein
MSETKTGLQENVAALYTYLFLWPGALVLLLLETENEYIRFHAMQSIIIFGALTVFVAIFNWIPVFGVIVRILVSVATVYLWATLGAKASQGEKYKFPRVGDLAEKLMS